MIHKINEPKFEPEMHDSRSQTGKRPPPVAVQSNVQQSTLASSNNDSRTPFLNVAQSHSLPANQTLPSFVQPFSQSPQLAGHPVNPFINNSLMLTKSITPTAADSKTKTMLMMEEERLGYLAAGGGVKAMPADNNSTSRYTLHTVSTGPLATALWLLSF